MLVHAGLAIVRALVNFVLHGISCGSNTSRGSDIGVFGNSAWCAISIYLPFG